MTSQQDPAWAATILLGTKEVQFKLDAGAEVTAIWEVTYKKLDALPLEKTQSLMWVDPSKPEGLRIVHWDTGASKGIVPHKLFLLFKKLGQTCWDCQRLPPYSSCNEWMWHTLERWTLVTILGTLGEEYQIQLKEGAVDEPTQWCIGMVIVQTSWNVRISVDLEPLNESVLREVHPMLKMVETLALLAGGDWELSSTKKCVNFRKGKWW